MQGDPEISQAVAARHFLFLCGAGRSGTTALAELLNKHPRIVMGIERFKYVYSKGSRAEEVTPALFDKDRFFSFEATDTNVLPTGKTKEIYDDMVGRYDTAKWVGDKVPRFYARYPQMLRRFSPARFIYIMRDPVRVASSWQVRADDTKDGWPEQNDFRSSIEEWNKANAATLSFMQSKPGRVHVVQYESIFDASSPVLEDLIRWLGLRYTPDFKAHHAQFASDAQAVAAKGSVLNAEAQAFVRDTADWKTAGALLQEAGILQKIPSVA